MDQKRLAIDDIATMSKAELARHWPEYFDSPVPKRSRREFLRMALAWQVQARTQGIDVASLHRRLKKLADALAAGKTPTARRKAQDLSAGTTLVRIWRGKSYTVTVKDNGFIFGGASYRSLSEIARKITGTRWNGPSFFGLRSVQAKPVRKASRGR